MITYLVGTDTYRIKEYLREHAPDALVGEEGIKYQGLFAQQPVILYEIPAGLKIPDDLEVFVVTDKKPRGKKTIIEFYPLEGEGRKAWIQKEAKALGFAIEQDVLATLIQSSTDSWQTKLELDKLACHAFGHASITMTDLTAVGAASLEQNIFHLTDAIAGKQKGNATVLLDAQLASGAEPYYLFSMIVGQFRNMLAPARAGVHPYAAQKARTAAQRFSADKLKELYRDLHKLELDTKNGERDLVDGLYEFIFSLS